VRLLYDEHLPRRRSAPHQPSRGRLLADRSTS
jgi:hypothetical protein